MRIGPEPMISTFTTCGSAGSRRSRAGACGPSSAGHGLAHVAEEVVEGGFVVARARCAFGVVLVRADRQRAVAKPLDGAVVQVAGAHDEAARLRDRRLVHLELVVLARDGDASGARVLHGVVASVMPERQA